MCDRILLKPSSPHKIIPIGTKFGSLIVTSEPFKKKTKSRNSKTTYNQIWYECKCNCGKNHITKSTSLRRTVSPARSCGCRINYKADPWPCRKCGRLTRKSSLCGKCWYEENPDKHRDWLENQRKSLKSFLKWRLYRARNRCRNLKKGIPFNLTLEFLQELLEKQHDKCALTGITMDTSKGPRSCTIDRIGSDKGYIIGNIQLVCLAINYAKNDFDNDEFIGFLNEIAELRQTSSEDKVIFDRNSE